MIVTFVSQCEKKALKKTRMVLDAFANRIGDNVWQTVITMEGLQAVKKQLRKTASKNTAVSCHWIRTRRRSELMWIVGSKQKFNERGLVPVNFTEHRIILGETNMSEIYANTKKQPLHQHLFAVGVVAQEIMKTFCGDKQLQKAAFVAGCWHDIGKLEIHFQNWIQGSIKKELKNENLITELLDNGVHIESGKFSFEKYPTHNEVSVLIYELLADPRLGKPEEKSIKHAIYWHHAKPIRKVEISSLNQVLEKLEDNKLEDLFAQSKGIMRSVNALSNNYFDEEHANHIKVKQVLNYEDEIDSIKLPLYKTYEISEKIEAYQKQIKKNAKENLIRAAVISADRLVSSLSMDELQNYIDNKGLEDFVAEKLIVGRGLNQHIKNCLDSFDARYPNSDRNKQQTEAAKNLADKEINIAVLNGPAGCGKTKIALEWALNISAKQIFWVCPRVAICQSLFNDLKIDDYLPNAIIEIHTSEFKYNNKKDELCDDEYFTGDIVLTTIDQIINSITTHRNISTLTKFMNATVVFDEFHEYIHMAGFNLLFAELIECKKNQQNESVLPNTLLVSATPNDYFVENFLDISNIQRMDSFNHKIYKIEFVDYDENKEDENNPLYQSVNKNTFVISNTAITAQKSFINNQEKENSLLIHSKFTPEDRKNIFKKMISSFKKNGTCQFDMLRSGPIIQAALNISCQNMISEMDIAENVLQRLGRLNRFAEHEIASLKIAVTEGIKTGKQVCRTAKFLGKNFKLQSTKVWYHFLSDKLNNKNEITISDLYKWYQEFYQVDGCVKMIEQDLISSLKDGIKVINNNIFDPLRVKLSKNSAVKIKKHSLRGNSRFVQMAIYEVKTKMVLDEYLPEAITLGVAEITGYGGSFANLLEVMKKRQHINIGGSSLTREKDLKIINNARDPEKPIYVSYTPENLKNYPANNDAIYYLQGVNQAIGTMRFSILQNN